MKSLKFKILVILIMAILLSIFILPFINKVYAATTYTQYVSSGIDAFPSEYQEALRQIQALHPNWTFDAYYTGIDWNTVILNETSTHGRNRIIKSADEAYKCSCGDLQSGYVCASEGIIKYYMDPRNFLNEVNIFQFLEISYNTNIHNLEGVKKSVKNTFLDNDVTYTYNDQTYTKSYSEIILEAANESNMSPYSIVTKIIQEVGTKGSDSVSGTYSGYEGYYNFYNWGSYDTGNAIVNGLLFARDQGWNNQYTAIIEGAKKMANSYTNAGQNTAYFYKWDVVGTYILKAGQSANVSSSDMYWHQYMTNVQDPTSQSKSLYNTYANNGVLEAKLNFVIPIYNNLPSTSSIMPTGFSTSDGDLYAVNCTGGLRVRSSASTSSSILTTLYRDTVVLMLDRECTNVDGLSWDKVRLSNGVEGYIASKYLTLKASSNKIDNTQNIEQNEEYKIENNNIIVLPGTTLEKIGNGATGEIKTGGTITIGENSYIVIVKGDSNGDGEINSADLLKIVKHLKNTVTINDAIYVKAADVTNDSSINSADLLKIVKYLKGSANLEI